MKKLVAFWGILIASTIALYAQDGMSVSYDTFKSWMKHSVVSGFNFVESDQENDGYTASFMQLNKMVGVKMLPSARFEIYKEAKGYDGAAPYEFKGAKLVYVNGTSSSSLFILSPKVGATVVITTSYFKYDKNALEKVAVEVGLGSKF
ncbi:hypothetical protein [Acetobacteroides hydrogenigenes]|uniref:Uncharacterized protein n=1 Tax=Acetobacteroides hydrogenigenes TaxID=979970 RepID=A0A4R2EP70_9BACT|nr:hypothetical protein [Acetobacteroides hydrogenigenes]TCN70653.1 hypothetical protein CLV25_103174 [Acetobacteroides hydrogenigenes]